MTAPPKVTYPGRKALFHVQRFETGDYGVIIAMRVGERLLAQGLVVEANRRRYARETDICVRLTDAGREYLKGIENG